MRTCFCAVLLLLAVFVQGQAHIDGGSLFRYTGPVGYTLENPTDPADLTLWGERKGGFTSNLGILFGPSARKSSREMGQGKADQWRGKSGVKILAQGTMTLGGRDAYFVETSHVRGDLKLFIYSVVCVTKGQVVNLNINGLLSDKAAIVKKFKASLSSFSWLK